MLLKLWSVREAAYATAAYPLTNSVELHLEIEFARYWAITSDSSDIKISLSKYPIKRPIV
ncbi:hypothetical protein BOW51_10855 [Solemya velesiana gill symbiont]|uniref:Uncharacterized protein n=1 Tax=Solemya velesiana gill symbiont TaxID=1918948 RepID=A0A1T2KS27_9GAMM|nr:hypothetical protein BOW51_10855 [Solemya velesiana gill symbiont]